MEGTLRGLALLGASALVVLAVWAILEKGAFISHLGSPPPEQFQPPLPDHPRTGFNPETRRDMGSDQVNHLKTLKNMADFTVKIGL
jgi:hypothetical protein